MRDAILGLALAATIAIDAQGGSSPMKGTMETGVSTAPMAPAQVPRDTIDPVGPAGHTPADHEAFEKATAELAELQAKLYSDVQANAALQLQDDSDEPTASALELGADAAAQTGLAIEAESHESAGATASASASAAAEAEAQARHQAFQAAKSSEPPKGMSPSHFSSFLELIERAASRHGTRTEQAHRAGANHRAEEKLHEQQWIGTPAAGGEVCENTESWRDNDKTPKHAHDRVVYEQQQQFLKEEDGNTVEDLYKTFDQEGPDFGHSCKAYLVHRWCGEKKGSPGKFCIFSGRDGDEYNNPEDNCCACGKGLPKGEFYCDLKGPAALAAAKDPKSGVVAASLLALLLW